MPESADVMPPRDRRRATLGPRPAARPRFASPGRRRRGDRRADRDCRVWAVELAGVCIAPDGPRPRRVPRVDGAFGDRRPITAVVAGALLSLPDDRGPGRPDPPAPTEV